MSFRIMKLSYVCKRVVIVPSFPTWWKMEKSAERDKIFCHLVCLFESRRIKVSPAALYTSAYNYYGKLGKRSSSATCVSFTLSSKMCTLILSLMHNNPLLNRKTTCHFPQDQRIPVFSRCTSFLQTSETCSHVYTYMHMHLYRHLFLYSILNNNCKMINLQGTHSASTVDPVH